MLPRQPQNHDAMYRVLQLEAYEPSQKYKEQKFILEKEKLMTVNWVHHSSSPPAEEPDSSSSASSTSE
jgi:hypothetical protein